MTDNKPKKAPSLDGFDHLLSRPHRTVEVTMAYEPADAVEADRLRLAMVRAERIADRDESDADAQVEADKARAEFNEFMAGVATMTFHFRSIGEHEYDALVSAHPATAQQLKDWRARTGKKDAHLRWDADEFPPRLIAACLDRVSFSDGTPDIDGLTVDQVRQLVTSPRFTAGDMSQLINGAEEVNLLASRIEDMGKG